MNTNYGSHLVGWWLSPTPLKNMKVSWDYYSQHMGKKTSGWWCNNHLENMSKWEGLFHI
jgi:hypothetical protein